jgi:hypothetical protein
MKKIYSKIPILLSFAVMAFSSFKSYSQCPHGQIPTAQMSMDRSNLPILGIIPKNRTNIDPYSLKYVTINKESGAYLFRIKQILSNCYTRFSSIKSIEHKVTITKI